MLTIMKRAWIRNTDVPMRQPAPGKINCLCGNAPETMYEPETGNITCACGTVYTWDGWIVTDEVRADPAALRRMGCLLR